jgi:hypothetical protein
LYKKGKTLSKQTHKKKIKEKNNEAKEVVSSSQYYYPRLAVGFNRRERKQTNKKQKTKKWKTIRRRSKKLVNFFVIRSVQNSFVSKRKIKKYLRR